MPLPWFTSATFAQQSDEHRSSINRSFIAPFAAHPQRRQFCGYCGTPLSSWNERTPDEAEHIYLTVGSLLDQDQDLLADLGFLSAGDTSDDDDEEAPHTEPQSRGAPWFEDLVHNTPLGRLKQQRGGHAANGVRVEWEIVEWTEGDEAKDNDQAPPAAATKRKLSDIEAAEEPEDADMQNS